MTAGTAGFELPSLPADEKLHRILRAALPPLPSPSQEEATHYWHATYFGLEQVGLFQASREREQQAILTIANQQLLEEAYSVEQAGMGYMAKMALMADSLEERMLYSLFAADETTHLAQLRPFLAFPISPPDAFLQYLSALAETDDKPMLLFVIQVLLEGWGLSHYRSLAINCQVPELAALFRSFLQAEARHHATGTTLFQQVELSRQSHAAIVEVLIGFLQMVQVGPQRLVQAIAQVTGGLTAAQRVQVFTDLQTEVQSGSRLRLLQSLMAQSGGGAIVTELVDRGAFEPRSAADCAKVMLG